MMRRLAALTATLAVAMAASIPAAASTPASTPITVPSSGGQTVTVTWTGTIPPGSNATSACTLGTPPTEDHHSIPITVPAGIYTSLDATFTFSISWTPPGAEDVSDEILTILDPAGNELASSDG